jgi:hypothetical protein
MRGWRYSSTILDLSSIWMYVLAFTPWPVPPLGRSHWYPLDRGWVAPQPIWMQWNRQNSVARAGNQIPTAQPVAHSYNTVQCFKQRVQAELITHTAHVFRSVHSQQNAHWIQSRPLIEIRIHTALPHTHNAAVSTATLFPLIYNPRIRSKPKPYFPAAHFQSYKFYVIDVLFT